MSDEEDIYFSGSEDDEESSPSNSSQHKENGSNLLIRSLKPPRATTYTASIVNEQIIRGDIDLNSKYQRCVWSKQRQIGFIDSVIRGFYVPPILFATTSRKNGSEKKTCIDGKQRLTSLHLFMTGVIPYQDAETGREYWFVNSNNKHGQLLPEHYRTIFSNKQIVFVEFEGLKDIDEKDIFSRVQLGMPLTIAEELPAISTLREGEVEDGAEWSLLRSGSGKRSVDQRAHTRAQEKSSDEGEGEQLEDETVTVPSKRRRSFGKSLGETQTQGSKSMKNKTTDSSSARHQNSSSKPKKPRKKAPKLNHVTLPTSPIPSSQQGTMSLQSPKL